VKKEVLRGVNEERNFVHTIQGKANWIGNIISRNCVLEHVIEGKIERRLEVTIRRGRRRKKLQRGLKEGRGYWKLKRKH